jgi:hypothetical protein
LIGNAIGDGEETEFESKALHFLSPLCYCSGGLMFHPSSNDESKHITELLGSEAFANLRVRKLPLPPQTLDAAQVTRFQKLQQTLGVFAGYVPVDIPFKQSDKRVNIDDGFAVNDGFASRYRRDRIAAGIRVCKHDGHAIWAIKDKVGHFRVLIPAPLEAHDDPLMVYWDLVVSFPPDYPYSKPVFRFLSVPPLKSVSPLGLVTVNQDRSFSVTLAVIQLLFITPEEWIQGELDGPKPRWTRATWWPQMTIQYSCRWNPPNRSNF